MVDFLEEKIGKHKCKSCDKEFELRMFIGWALIDGKPEKATVYYDRPACPRCSEYGIEYVGEGASRAAVVKVPAVTIPADKLYDSEDKIGEPEKPKKSKRA